ncbi:MAG: ABC transporter permease [Chloroflexi bacterium]|nr:ABC transporter permease [Chloroflexota bacterium]
MRSFWLLFMAAAREWRRDPTALMWTMVFPIMLSVSLGMVFASDRITLPVAVINQDGPAGEALVAAFRDHPSLKVSSGDLSDEITALKDGQRRAVVVIPVGAGTAARDDPAALRVYYDSSHQNAPLVVGVLQEVVRGLNVTLVGEAPPISIQPETVSAGEFRRLDYMLPGVLAVALMQLALFVTAPLLVSLRERHVLRRLGATPLSPAMMLVSQIVFRLCIALGQAALLIALGTLWLDVHVEITQLPAVLGVTLLGSAGLLTFGYFLAALAKTEEAIQVFIGLPNALFMLLSGAFFPVDDMPRWTRPIVDLMPLTYLCDALRQTMVHAPPLHSLTTDILVLAGWGIGCALLAVRFFRWEPQG